MVWIYAGNTAFKSAVRVELLSRERTHLAWGSGFFAEINNTKSLFTCFHVVTGYLPSEIPAQPKLERRVLRIQQGFLNLANSEYDIELYDADGRAKWSIFSAQSGTEKDLIPLPISDVVYFNVPDLNVNYFPESSLVEHPPDALTDLAVVGFPFGYSQGELIIKPTFIKRSKANGRDLNFGLLDGPGARGMSGGAVVWKFKNEFRLVGVYTGELYPEAQEMPSELGRDERRRRPMSALPLGCYVPIYSGKDRILSRKGMDDEWE